MNKIYVVDSNYNDEGHKGMAASWLLWELDKRGIKPCNIIDADFVFMTTSSQQGVSRVRSEVRAIKKINKKCKIILGGGGCYAPAIFEDFVDAICVGEGANFIEVFLCDGYETAKKLPEVWIKNETRKVIPSTFFPFDIPPLNHPDGTVRVFASRGCRFKCAFCQTGYESPFRVNPDKETLQKRIEHIEKTGRRIAIVTNDAADENVHISGQQEFISATVHNLLKMNITRKDTKGIRVGVEGISERLRLAVGKKVENDKLLELSFNAFKNGVGVRWFFVPGLPGENDNDWEEMKYLVRQIKKIPKGVVMMNFHSFIPMPATPLGIFPTIDEYWERFDEFRRWFFHGDGFTRHVQIVSPNMYPSRMKRATESMAATEEEIRRGWWNDDNKNWRVQYLFTPDQLRARAKKYANRVGL